VTLSLCAIAAPAVSASSTQSTDQTGDWSELADAVGFDLTAPAAYVDDWAEFVSLGEVAAAPVPLAQETSPDPIVGWHSTSNTSGHLPQAVSKPNPKPTQPRSDARKIIRLARKTLGADFRMGAVGGGNNYDCSGLVYAVYKDAGLLSRVGGYRRGATSFYNWFKSRGLVSRKNGKPGDLVVYQHKGERVIPHMGIYIGNGRVISALINPWGVRTHGLKRIGIPFKAFLHVRIGR
jgi:cell wall-associated NlpC family hydrolase